MKYLIMLGGLILAAKISPAQIKNPVHWSYHANRISQDTWLLHLRAQMEPGWHIYAQKQPEEAISIPTKIEFSNSANITLLGTTKELGKKEKYENKEVDIVQYQYGNKVDFVQTVKVRDKNIKAVTGNITYQTCKEEECLPPQTISFSITLRD